MRIRMKWLEESNRYKHLTAGGVVAVMTAAITLIIFGCDMLGTSVMSLYVTIVAAVSVEYKDKLWGGRFDWLDILATCLIPLAGCCVGLLCL